MNKQELIKKLRSDLYLTPDNQFKDGYNSGVKNSIILVKELKEIKKPVVPQFVADWYEDNKDDFEYNVYFLCVKFYENELKEEFKEWFNSMDNKPIETLVDMHKYGYEVEKEKLYTVEIPNSNYQDSGHLVLRKDGKGKVFLDWYRSENWKEFDGVKLTEAEIKEDFAWALQFAKEVNND